MTKKNDGLSSAARVTLHACLHDVQMLMGSPVQNSILMNAALARLNEELFHKSGTTRVAWVVLTRQSVAAGDRGKVGTVFGIALFTADRKVAENPAVLWTTTARAAFGYIFEQRGFDVLPYRDSFGDRLPEQRKRVPMAVFEDGCGVKFTTVLT